MGIKCKEVRQIIKEPLRWSIFDNALLKIAQRPEV